MRARLWMGVAWPAFLAAAALEMVVFAMVDPSDLHWFGRPLDASRQTVYTAAFFAFWAVATVSSALTALLIRTPNGQLQD